MLIQFAKILEHARKTATPIEPITKECQNLTLQDAYAIQKIGIDLQKQEGKKIVGYKMGLTSKAKMEQMGLATPIYGTLMGQTQLESGGLFTLKGSIHPKIEPELAFLIKNNLQWPVTKESVLDACEGVCAAMEIIDSRYIGFKYFGLPDVVADNSSSFAFVLSKKIADPKKLDLENLKVEIKINGALTHTGQSNAILGNPLNSILELCSILNTQNLSILAESVVLAGAVTQATPLEKGMLVQASVESLGEVSININ